jgi:hypothetical protein
VTSCRQVVYQRGFSHSIFRPGGLRQFHQQAIFILHRAAYRYDFIRVVIHPAQGAESVTEKLSQVPPALRFGIGKEVFIQTCLFAVVAGNSFIFRIKYSAATAKGVAIICGRPSA